MIGAQYWPIEQTFFPVQILYLNLLQHLQQYASQDFYYIVCSCNHPKLYSIRKLKEITSKFEPYLYFMLVDFWDIPAEAWEKLILGFFYQQYLFWTNRFIYFYSSWSIRVLSWATILVTCSEIKKILYYINIKMIETKACPTKQVHFFSIHSKQKDYVT